MYHYNEEKSTTKIAINSDSIWLFSKPEHQHNQVDMAFAVHFHESLYASIFS
jgi:hypothetical protein